MEIMKMITDLMCNKKVDKLYVEFWEPNDGDNGEHLVKINMETEVY